VRGIKGSDLLSFGSTAVKNRIKGKNTANFVWDTFHSMRNWARYDQKYILVFMWRILIRYLWKL